MGVNAWPTLAAEALSDIGHQLAGLKLTGRNMRSILEDDGELKVYYGAADQVMCLASAPVDDVLALCLA